MRNGRTIAAKRERPERESERMLARKRARLKMTGRWGLVIGAVVVAAVLVVRGVGMFVDMMEAGKLSEVQSALKFDAEIIDETDAGVTRAVREYVANLEGDLAEYGYKMTKAVLPVGYMRQVNIYIEGLPGYIKTRTDRGTAVQAEDIDRMVRYLNGGAFEYIDVRVEKKGYWK